MKFILAAAVLIASSFGFASNRCAISVTPKAADGAELTSALKEVLKWRTDKIKQKESGLEVEVPVFQWDRTMSVRDLEQFHEDTIEIVLTGGSSQYGHTILRLGKRVFDFRSVRGARIAEDFQVPSESPGNRGYAFFVGREKIAEVIEEVTKFYQSMVRSNVPAFDGSGSRLLLLDLETNSPRYKSVARYSRGGSVENPAANNSPFDGRIVKDEQPNGQEKLFLESPSGIRVRVGQQEDGQYFIQSLSCASSAIEVVRKFIGLDLMVDTVSARGLVRKISEGNFTGTAFPMALMLYGPEKKAPPADVWQAAVEPELRKANNLRAPEAPVQPGIWTKIWRWLTGQRS